MLKSQAKLVRSMQQDLQEQVLQSDRKRIRFIKTLLVSLSNELEGQKHDCLKLAKKDIEKAYANIEDYLRVTE